MALEGKVQMLLTLEQLAMVGTVAVREWVKHRPIGHRRGLVVAFAGAGHAARSGEGGKG